jgi:hypothetical protein
MIEVSAFKYGKKKAIALWRSNRLKDVLTGLQQKKLQLVC